MEFKITEPDQNYIYKELSDGGTVEIGIYPTMYGFRARAGFVGDSWVQLDWCAGDNQLAIEWLFTRMKVMLSARVENKHVFDGIPTNSDIKPFYKDHKFVISICKLYELVSPPQEDQKLPNLRDLKIGYVNNLFSETPGNTNNK